MNSKLKIGMDFCTCLLYLFHMIWTYIDKTTGNRIRMTLWKHHKGYLILPWTNTDFQGDPKFIKPSLLLRQD